MRLGYGEASMDLIAAEAGVSKQTVYNHFHSKEALFKAIVEDVSAAVMEPMRVRDPAGTTPRRQLSALGREFLALMLQPSSLALYRLIVAESGRFPELGGDVYAVGAGRLIALLADYLAWETRNGRLGIDDPDLAAETFVGALTGRLQLRALLGVRHPPDEAELSRRVDYVVSGFLARYGAERAAPG